MLRLRFRLDSGFTIYWIPADIVQRSSMFSQKIISDMCSLAMAASQDATSEVLS
ncbi:hypothetical protein L917_07880 [Phytophthora nicotianae]|uniref:Uncharacterized protein n=1 Tax=Phytophthora nicotianae TaxID=4792 RepID=W2L9C7_PHYNI|nr:hypothetical protein L917_07880 [Phytophthora nicotianae]